MVFGFLSRLGSSLLGSGGVTGFLKPISGFISKVFSPIKNLFGFGGSSGSAGEGQPGGVQPGLMGKVNYAIDKLMPHVANFAAPYVDKAR
jgi:hypothetical protein